MYMLCLYL